MRMIWKLGLLIGLLAVATEQSYMRNHINGLANQPDKFMYFAYGSNMLEKRIHMQNPSAKKIGPAEIKNYRLDFNSYTERWDGAPATVVPDNTSTVFGTMWHIDLKDIESLDRQEGVHDGIYVPLGVPAEVYGVPVFARVYVLANQPEIANSNYTVVPMERRPSKTYLQCIVKGALETGLLNMYVHYLKNLPHNGRTVPELQQFLELDGVEIYT